jgi:hypothetical protein
MVTGRIKSGPDKGATEIRNLSPLRAPEIRHPSGLGELHEPRRDVSTIVKREIPNQTCKNPIQDIADRELFGAARQRWQIGDEAPDLQNESGWRHFAKMACNKLTSTDERSERTRHRCK